MGDSRFHLKVEFEIFGKEYKWSPSLNYYDRGDGIDDRIFQWFVSCYEDAYRHWEASMEAANAERERIDTERREREELRRLKEKYEGNHDQN